MSDTIIIDLGPQKEAVERKSLKLREVLLDKQLRIAEAISPVNGMPIDYASIWDYNGRPAMSIWGNDIYPERSQTIRTLQDLRWARDQSRVLAETNPNGQAVLRALTAYVVGTGSNVTTCSADEDTEPPVRLNRKLLRFIKKTKKVNKWHGLEKEIESRLHADGEVFLRLFPDEDNVTKVRFVEPLSVQPPANADWEGPWSWGVLTIPGDTQTPVAYNLHDWRTGEDECVEAIYIVHIKINVDRNVKRGIPSFWSCDDELIGSQKLRHATREGEKVRASIAFFRQWATAAKSAIDTMNEENMTAQLLAYSQGGVGTTGGATTVKEIRVQKVETGSVIDAPAGMEIKAPPQSPNSEAAAKSVDQSLMSVAARFNMPYSVVSGDVQDANFAAALTAEAPFTKSVETDQQVISEAEVDVWERIIEIGVEQDELPPDVLEEIEVKVEFPSPVIRDRAVETDRNAKLNEAGVLSRKTWAGREDLDAEQEQANILEEGPRLTAQNSDSNPAPSPTPGAAYSRSLN